MTKSPIVRISDGPGRPLAPVASADVRYHLAQMKLSADDLIAAWPFDRAPEFEIIADLFPSPDLQLAQLVLWSQQQPWPLSELKRAEAAIASLPATTGTLKSVAVLVPWQDNSYRTTEWLWSLVNNHHQNAYCWFSGDGPSVTPLITSMTILHNRPEPANRLQWVVLDLTAGIGEPFKLEQGNANAAGYEVLALAAHAPIWAGQLGYNTAAVLLTGLCWNVAKWGAMIPELTNYSERGRIVLNGYSMERDNERHKHAKPLVTWFQD